MSSPEPSRPVTPEAEVSVNTQLVAALLTEQHPDLADEPLRLVGEGWDNVAVRIGSDLVARLPRRAAAVPLLANEQRVLPGLARRLTLPIPEPLRLGDPGCGYPWSWSICRWFEGTTASHADLDQTPAVDQIATFWAQLHQPAPVDAPANAYRGVALTERRDVFIGHVRQAQPFLDPADPRQAATALIDRFDALAAASAFAGPPVWIHGDLHTENVIVHHGRLAAAIDWGDVTSGDPATDLAIAWMLFDAEHRQLLASLGGYDDATWQRAQGWALAFAIVYLALPSKGDDPASSPMVAVGRRLLAEVLGSLR